MADLSIFKLDNQTITIKDTTARQAAESAKTLATAAGNAVREQITELKSAFNSEQVFTGAIVNNKIGTISKWLRGYYSIINNKLVLQSGDTKNITTDPIFLPVGVDITVKTTKTGSACFIREYGYINGELTAIRTAGNNSSVMATLENTKEECFYLIVNYNSGGTVPADGEYTTFTVKSGISDIAYNLIALQGNYDETSQKTENLFNKFTITNGYRLGENGAFVASEGQYISDYIPVTVGKTYIRNNVAQDAYHRFVFYDSNKEYVSKSNNNENTIASGTVFARFCGYLTELDTTYFEEKQSTNTFIPYRIINNIINPEMYGAVGDGVTDDSTAINTCIAAAKLFNQIIVANGIYATASPIMIDGSKMNIFINGIIYSGDTAAVIIKSQFSKIEINNIKASNGAGARFTHGTAFSTKNNEVHINHIEVINSNSGNAIEIIDAGNIIEAARYIYGNNITFECIEGNGKNYGIFAEAVSGSHNTIMTNNIYGGTICRFSWNVYGDFEGYKFVNFDMEASSGRGNGFYLNGKANAIITPRNVELNGADNNYGFLISPSSIADNNYLQIIGELPINCIDLSNAGEFGVNNYKVTNIDCSYVIDSFRNRIYLSRGAKIISDRLYLIDPIPRYKQITTETFNAGGLLSLGVGEGITNLSDTAIGNSNVFTCFIVDTINTEISLSYQYSELGTDRFTVIQDNGYKAIVKDEFERTIFDGSEKPDGVYSLRCYVLNNYLRGRNENTVKWVLD